MQRMHHLCSRLIIALSSSAFASTCSIPACQSRKLGSMLCTSGTSPPGPVRSGMAPVLKHSRLTSISRCVSPTSCVEELYRMSLAG